MQKLIKLNLFLKQHPKLVSSLLTFVTGMGVLLLFWLENPDSFAGLTMVGILLALFQAGIRAMLKFWLEGTVMGVKSVYVKHPEGEELQNSTSVPTRDVSPAGTVETTPED